jgi:hypothetical protein
MSSAMDSADLLSLASTGAWPAVDARTSGDSPSLAAALVRGDYYAGSVAGGGTPPTALSPRSDISGGRGSGAGVGGGFAGGGGGGGEGERRWKRTWLCGSGGVGVGERGFRR